MSMNLGKDSLKKKYKKKKLNPRKALMKTLAYFRSKGVPLGFIQDSIISGYGYKSAARYDEAATAAGSTGKTGFTSTGYGHGDRGKQFKITESYGGKGGTTYTKGSEHKGRAV